MYYRFPSFRPNPPSETKTAQECLTEILSRSESQRHRRSLSVSSSDAVPDSQGRTTELKPRAALREEAKMESKGSGLGSWSTWKAGEMAKQSETRGGDYEDAGADKNSTPKGPWAKLSRSSKARDEKK